MNKNGSDDEIMAEHLLKGHKMLPNSCVVCGNPLFSIKGKTVCVICPEQEDLIQEKQNEHVCEKHLKNENETGELKPVCDLSESLQGTLINLCRKIDACDDAERCSKLMDVLKTGIEALVKLY